MTPSISDLRYQEVIAANQKVHTALAGIYNASEPQFRPENVAHVESRLRPIFEETKAKRLLDLGCGTGFIIDIAKKYVPEIDGVDVTEAMLRQVDCSGEASIRLHLGDAGVFPAEADAYDVVTAYSFLHHLYDIGPTLTTASQALRPGGKFYVDLEPNYYFWSAMKSLPPEGSYHSIVERERAAVLERGSQIENQYRIDREVFDTAEYGKNETGGFAEERLAQALYSAGFSGVSFSYYWFLGQAGIVNDSGFGREQAVMAAQTCAEALTKALPLTRHLFKYVGFVAIR